MLTFKDVDYSVPDLAKVGGVTFNMSTTNFSKTTDESEVVLLKNRSMLDGYRDMFGGKPIRNILEFGTWEGGSPLFFAAATNAERIVGIDLRDPVEPLRHHSEPFSDRMRIHYNTSQSDREAVTKIIDTEFSDPIDLIIDDASHMYEHTRAAFEIAFPRLRVGGSYVIEDWNWAHYPDPKFDDYWHDQPALSNLAMELVIAVGSFTPIASVKMLGWHIEITKGAEIDRNFRLDDLMRLGPKRHYTKF
ncbi:hypothetical protein HYN69_03690 [Gemmobacter aquarius]|uniref:Methyltransferase domain-containing protein n=1 Tax=Paragemmobacter aquarius TaxID=2169400 RepID=A0A2S0UIR4_9RHOB|nr:class I SAM-dependent methyltransferase [Gemmobacter aquarius]AWB47722.1 hypothetical protein HYN69_03690 [Gemmobacter aquarius]